jgi:hypothetical protein
MSKYLFSILSLLTLLLTGCGSDGDGDSSSGGTVNNGNGGNTGGNGNITYVAGEFKTANDSSHYFPDDSSLSGNLAAECIYQYNYNYFESANTRIYGNPALPDTDFKYAATLIENNLDKALNLMGLDRSEFNNFRPRYSSIVASNMISFLDGYEDLDRSNLDIAYIDSDFVAPAGWAEMQYSARLNVIKGYWNTITDEKQDRLIALYNERYDYDLTDNSLVPEKIVVCLDTTRDKVLYGQGTLLGMNIAPNSMASRSDAEQVILHELIHTIQLNVSTPIDAGGVNDIWFMEGQASFLAGQKVAASAGGFYPVNVVHFADVDTVFQDNLGVAYEHYAKAYSYIDANSGKEAALNLLIDVRRYQGGGTSDTYYGVSSDRFSEAFDANMLKKDGSQLTIENFRNNYHSFFE